MESKEKKDTLKRRICLYAGAGAGKSTTAAWLFSELKRKNIAVEFITEYVKSWAWQNRKPTSFDQVYIQAKQLHYEDRVLRNGCDLIITDCPILLSSIYARTHFINNEVIEGMEKIVKAYEHTYPSINLYIVRDEVYNPKGRWGTRDDSIKVDEFILKALEEFQLPFQQFNKHNTTGILEYVLKSIY